MDPFTISAGISAIGGLFQGITGLFGDNAQAKAEKNAARQAQAEAGVNAQERLQEGDATAASAAVQAAANGGGLVGSSLGVIQDLSDRAMFNARAAVYRGNTQAQSDLYDAQVDQTQGLRGLIGSGFGAAGSIYGGLGRSAYQRMGQVPSAPGVSADFMRGLF